MPDHPRAVYPQPLVSVLVPVFNSGSFLRQTLDSILCQTYPRLEVIVCDDGSHDESYCIAQSYSDPRIQLSRNLSNLGAAANWNHVLHLASGEYLKIMGADDVLDPTCIAEQVSVLNEDASQSLALVVCQRRVINGNSRVLINPSQPRLAGLFDNRQVAKVFVRSGNNPIGEPVTGLFRRSTAIKTLGFRETFPYMIDADFWFQLLDHGRLFAQKETLCAFRISGTSWTSRLGARQYRQYIGFVKSLKASGKYDLSVADLRVSALHCAVKTAGRFVFSFMLR